MTRRSIFSTLAGFFVGKKVVGQPSEADLLLAAIKFNTFCGECGSRKCRGECMDGPVGDTGPVGPVGMPGPRGPSADGQNETEAEHAQHWADAEEWNRRWYERGSV